MAGWNDGVLMSPQDDRGVREPPEAEPLTPKQAYHAKINARWGRRVWWYTKWIALPSLAICIVVGLFKTGPTGGTNVSGVLFFYPVAFIPYGIMLFCWLLDSFPTATAIWQSYSATKHLAQGELVRAGASGVAAYEFSKRSAEMHGDEWAGATGFQFDWNAANPGDMSAIRDSFSSQEEWLAWYNSEEGLAYRAEYEAWMRAGCPRSQPQAKWSPSPQAWAGGAGLVAGMAHNHRETTERLDRIDKRLKEQQ